MKFIDYAENFPQMPTLVHLGRTRGPGETVDIPSARWDEIKHFDMDLFKKTYLFDFVQFVNTI